MKENEEATGVSKLLSINIPVYKRPDLLRTCLLKTMAAIESFDIAVNVFDDSADDTNVAVLSELQARYPLVSHIRNPVNLGIDRNIDQAARYGLSDYIWLLGEDDFLLPGAITALLPHLRGSVCPVVVVNYGFIRNDLSSFSKTAVIPVAEAGLIDAGVLLASYGWSMGFIGSCVIRRVSFSKVSPKKYLDTYFSHLGCIFEAAYGEQCAIVATPLVANRAEDLFSTSWASDALKVFFGMERLFRLLSPPYSAETIADALKSARPALPFRSLRGLVSLRAHGVLAIGTWREINRLNGVVLKIASGLLVMVPVGSIRFLQCAKRALEKWLLREATIE